MAANKNRAAKRKGPAAPGPDQARPRLNQARPGVRNPEKATDGPKPAPASTGPATRPKPAAPPPARQGNLLLLAAVGVVALALAGLIAFLLLGGNSQASNNAGAGTNVPAAAATGQAGDVPAGPDPSAQVETFPNQGQAHLQPGQTVESLLGGQSYNSNPPTSGPHLPNWSNWGVFTGPVSDQLQVHNLEHGGIIIQYDCPSGCPGTINALSGYARRYPPQNFTGILLAPRSNLPEGARIALTAWTRRLLLKSLDTDKINQFIAGNIGKGPEVDPNFMR